MFVLASVLFLVGCEGIGEREAQSEFERLRNRTIPPQGDRFLPSFRIEPSSAEVRRSAPGNGEHSYLRRDTSTAVMLP